MKMNDPLQTLYQLMSGRQPAAVSVSNLHYPRLENNVNCLLVNDLCIQKNHEPCLLHYVTVSLNVAMHVKMVSNSKEFQSGLHPIQLQEDKILHVKINKNVPVNTEKTTTMQKIILKYPSLAI